MFQQFKSQEERSRFGGSAFIELQYCKMPKDTTNKKIVSSKYAKYWQNDSLYIYINDIDLFLDNFGKIFNQETSSNLKTGLVDVFGYNYYSAIQVKEIIDKINVAKPLEYKTILSWLEKSKNYNGFYLLGI